MCSKVGMTDAARRAEAARSVVERALGQPAA
jgi:hypothetical protein